MSAKLFFLVFLWQTCYFLSSSFCVQWLSGNLFSLLTMYSEYVHLCTLNASFSAYCSVTNLMLWDNVFVIGERTKIHLFGGAGYRSRYLSHAKRALYHLSYAPRYLVLPYFFSLSIAQCFRGGQTQTARNTALPFYSMILILFFLVRWWNMYSICTCTCFLGTTMLDLLF